MRQIMIGHYLKQNGGDCVENCFDSSVEDDRADARVKNIARAVRATR